MRDQCACLCSTSLPHPLVSGRHQGQLWSMGPREFACPVSLKNFTAAWQAHRLPSLQQTQNEINRAHECRALGRVLLSTGEWLVLAELDTAEAAIHSYLCILEHNTLSGRSRSQHQSCNRTVPKNLVIPPLHGAATLKAINRMGRTTQRVSWVSF